jgi:hypothetical protein
MIRISIIEDLGIRYYFEWGVISRSYMRQGYCSNPIKRPVPSGPTGQSDISIALVRASLLP